MAERPARKAHCCGFPWGCHPLHQRRLARQHSLPRYVRSRFTPFPHIMLLNWHNFEFLPLLKCANKVTKKQPSPNNYANGRPSPKWPGTGWANTEFRTFHFTDSADTDDLYGNKIDGDNASIRETPDSRKRRGKTVAEPPSREMQKEFFLQAIAGWETQAAEALAADRTTGEKERAMEIMQKQPIPTAE